MRTLSIKPRRTVQVAAGILAGACAVWCMGQATDQRSDPSKPQNTPPRDARAVAVNIERDAAAVAQQLQSSNFTLSEAIRVAEDHCKGKAVAAMGQTTGSPTPCIKVAVLDSGKNLKCVSVGFDRKVIDMKDWKDAGFASMGAVNNGAHSHDGKIVRADKVIGKSVVNSAGDDLGKIEDLAIDPQEGRIGYAVLSFGGIMGAGDKLFAVPWPALQPHAADKFVIAATEEQLKNAPGFNKSSWPDMSDLKWNETVHGYYQQPYYWSENRDTDSARSTSTARRPMVYKASDVIGMVVHNVQDERLGEIQDIVLDPADGDIRYAVLSVGGFLGVRERYIAVPWPAFTYDSTGKKVTLDVNKDRVKQAPGFDKNNWPDFADQQWGGDVHRYYNQKPYWTPSSGKQNP